MLATLAKDLLDIKTLLSLVRLMLGVRMPQGVKSTLLLYADDWYILYQHKEVDEIEKLLNKDFENICGWFVDKKLRTHFGDGKTKSVLFTNKRRLKNVHHLNVRYKHINTKQHSQVTYLNGRWANDTKVYKQNKWKIKVSL